VTVSNESAIQAQTLSQRIAEVLCGNPPEVQGAALADALAFWLAGHQMEDAQELAQLRAGLLDLHVERVKVLLPINDEIIKAWYAKGGNA